VSIYAEKNNNVFKKWNYQEYLKDKEDLKLNRTRCQYSTRAEGNQWLIADYLHQGSGGPRQQAATEQFDRRVGDRDGRQPGTQKCHDEVGCVRPKDADIAAKL